MYVCNLPAFYKSKRRWANIKKSTIINSIVLWILVFSFGRSVSSFKTLCPLKPKPEQSSNKSIDYFTPEYEQIKVTLAHLLVVLSIGRDSIMHIPTSAVYTLYSTGVLLFLLFLYCFAVCPHFILYVYFCISHISAVLECTGV